MDGSEAVQQKHYSLLGMVNPTHGDFKMHTLLKSSALALTVLMIGTVMADAEQKSSSPKDNSDCKKTAQQIYNTQVNDDCPHLNGQTTTSLAVCIAVVAEALHTNLENCDDETVELVVHTRTGLFDPSLLRGADTSGGHGDASADSSGGPTGGGGSGGGSGKPGGNFNAGMTNATMTSDGGGGTIY